ncbi:DUF4259 domain-containing protein [Undibacterium sp. Ji42W]|uniref:DUF4259 domain-containing protein n=1 Tax=Undibacterium sp. Ji42W TaxID=3413039 RepID=UPI003BF442F8
MGAWAADSFGNDTACDWAYAIEDCHDLSLVEETLNKILQEGDGYIDASDAEEAIAAIEVIARLQGNWGTRNAYSESVDKWVRKTKLVPGKELVEKAHKVVAKILGDESELKELWADSNLSNEWIVSVQELAGRVKL